MIAFDKAGARFNFRVGGVAYRADHVLLQTERTIDFWVVPGGRPEILESAAEGLTRELREELSVEAQVQRLLWVAENFFELDSVRFHELGLYFLVDLPASLPFDREFAGHEPGYEISLRWFPLDNLPTIKPSFLREGLRNPPTTIEHIVHRD